jgi:DedD protein
VARASVSDDEIQLRKRARRRLVGAIALVVVVVAVLPMVLDSQPRQAVQHVEVQIPPIPQQAAGAPSPAQQEGAPGAGGVPPSTDGGQTGAQRSALRIGEDAPGSGAAGAPQSSPAPAPSPAAPAPSAASSGELQPGGDAHLVSPASVVPAQPVAAQAAPEKPAPGKTPAATKPVKPTPTAAGGYAVQIMATGRPEKAREMKQQLAHQKFPVYVEKTPDGEKTRVRVGPYSTREAAEQARQRLAKLNYDPGKVVRKGE